MGRSGGGFRGGGRSSGGFSGGRRSSGGFSGGGRSSGGGHSFGGGRPFGTSGRVSSRPRSVRTGPIIINNSPRYGGQSPRDDRNSWEGPERRRNGRTAGAVVVVVWLVILALGLLVLATFLRGGSSTQSSTHQREKLPASAVTETAYYTDEGGWFSNRAQLERGMRSFYQETGVQPYLYLLPNGSAVSASSLTEMAEELYPELFSDEGHFLLLFCDDNSGSYTCGYTVGAQAKTVMDDEAVAILADYLDRYYQDYSISEEEIFSNAFEKTGEQIMTVTKSPLPTVAACATVIVVALVVFLSLKGRREQQERERRRTEEILKTPLEKFGDQDIEDLAGKYETEE